MTHQQTVADLESVYAMFKPKSVLDQIENIAKYANVLRAGKTISQVRYADGSEGAIRTSRLPKA